MKISAVTFYSIILFLLHAAPAHSQEFGRDIPQDLQEAFHDEISRVASRSFYLSGQQFSPIRKINRSYQLTAEAVGILAEKGDVAAAIEMLQEASIEDIDAPTSIRIEDYHPRCIP
jgi:hypothetical protein